MKARIIILMAAWLAWGAVAKAADELTLSAESVRPGEEAELTVSLSEENQEFVGFQFDIELANGLSLVNNSNGKLYAFPESQTNSPICDVEDLGSGKYRFLVYSDVLSHFNSGKVINLRLKAASGMAYGKYKISMNNVILSDAKGKTVKSNGENYDVGVVGESLSMKSITIKPDETGNTALSIQQETERFTGIQFDVTLPDGLTLEAGTDGKVYELSANQPNDLVCDIEHLGSNKYRFVVYSNSLMVLKNGEVMSLQIKAQSGIEQKGYSVQISQIMFSDPKGQVEKLSSSVATINVIASVPITIKADDQTRSYGDANPEWTYSVTGGDIFGSGKPVLSCEATVTSPVGKYDITVEKGTVENPATLTSGTLTITKAPLTITAKSYSIKQGEPLPEFEISYSGFKNNETANVLKAKPSVNCAATAASEPGRYDIIVSGATADNYDITYVKGTLRIRSLVAEPGDLNNDGEVDVTDVVELIDMVLAGSTDPSGDINGDGEVDVTDVVELIDMVLSGD